MEIQKAFSIFDSKAEAYLQPFFAPTAGVALRNFEAAANDVNHDFNKYAGDYTLFEIGTFDTTTAGLVPHTSLINLGLALNLIQPDYQTEAGKHLSAL